MKSMKKETYPAQTSSSFGLTVVCVVVGVGVETVRCWHDVSLFGYARTILPNNLLINKLFHISYYLSKILYIH